MHVIKKKFKKNYKIINSVNLFIVIFFILILYQWFKTCFFVSLRMLYFRICKNISDALHPMTSRQSSPRQNKFLYKHRSFYFLYNVNFPSICNIVTVTTGLVFRRGKVLIKDTSSSDWIFVVKSVRNSSFSFGKMPFIFYCSYTSI